MINCQLLLYFIFLFNFTSGIPVKSFQGGNCTRLEEEPYIYCEIEERKNSSETVDKGETASNNPSGFTVVNSDSDEEPEAATFPPENDELRKELSEPPPIRKDGPTIMEELFIDSLTGPNHQVSSSTLRGSLAQISTRELFLLCRRFLPFARRHCHREFTLLEYIEPCRGYFQDCKRYIPRRNLVHDFSRVYQQSVLYGNNGYPFRLFPDYNKK
ncbi:hypothetical protein FO519_001040 [Halicephalobus sp. NKZ332]|nr:hypothetical protein FO519_001040 [Halicephalobus sp. NKZ332]